MKSQVRGILLYAMLSTACFSCQEEYAVVRVDAIDHASGANPAVAVYDGTSGQFLGNTPSLLVTLVSRHPRRDGVISLVTKSNDYSTTILVGKVTKWAPDDTTAHQAEYFNNFLIEVTKKSP